MKFYILFFALVVAAVSAKATYLQPRQNDVECLHESHAREEELNTFFSDWHGEPKEAIKCYIKCIMEKEGIWNNDGFSAPPLAKSEVFFEKVLDNCKDKKGTDACDTAYLITKCLRNSLYH